MDNENEFSRPPRKLGGIGNEKHTKQKKNRKNASGRVSGNKAKWV